MSDDPYVYPGTSVLRNKLQITNGDALDAIERQFVMQRSRETIPRGDFDLAHLRRIHKHLFQDVYDWAGELRRVEISKSGEQFQFRQYIETGMEDIHRRLARDHYLHAMTAEEFARKAGAILGDVNYVHPFREGNGRTQLYYLKQLGEQAGHPIDLTRLPTTGWIEASRAARQANYESMSQAIAGALISQGQSRGRGR